MGDQSVRAGRAKAVLMVLAAVAGVASIAGCADTRGGPIAYSETFAAPDAPTVVPLEAGYKIAPLDTITVKVFKMPDLSGDYEVDLTGQISMPLIGEVPAVELTTAELDRRLTEKLGERYLENPDVSVMLIIESGKTRTRAARESIERISAAGAHIVGATLTKSSEEASQYGYRLYQYTSVADKRNQIVLIPQQAEG